MEVGKRAANDSRNEHALPNRYDVLRAALVIIGILGASIVLIMLWLNYGTTTGTLQ